MWQSLQQSSYKTGSREPHRSRLCKVPSQKAALRHILGHKEPSTRLSCASRQAAEWLDKHGDGDATAALARLCGRCRAQRLRESTACDLCDAELLSTCFPARVGSTACDARGSAGFILPGARRGRRSSTRRLPKVLADVMSASPTCRPFQNILDLILDLHKIHLYTRTPATTESNAIHTLS